LNLENSLKELIKKAVEQINGPRNQMNAAFQNLELKNSLNLAAEVITLMINKKTHNHEKLPSLKTFLILAHFSAFHIFSYIFTFLIHLLIK